jgi:acyl-CoA thioesterase FadM
MIDNVVAPSDTQRDGAHVVDFEIQKLLSLGWQKYVAVVRDMAGDRNHAVVRHIATSYEGECFGGDQLVRGVHALNRTRRSYVLEEVLLHQATKRPVASSTVVVASVDPATGKAVPIPDELWCAIQEFEGRELRVTESQPNLR